MHVDGKGIRAKTFVSSWRMSESGLAADDIEEVNVGKSKRGKLELRASGDAGAVTFGAQILSLEELNFVRSCIIVTVARGRR